MILYDCHEKVVTNNFKTFAFIYSITYAIRIKTKLLSKSALINLSWNDIMWRLMYWYSGVNWIYVHILSTVILNIIQMKRANLVIRACNINFPKKFSRHETGSQNERWSFKIRLLSLLVIWFFYYVGTLEYFLDHLNLSQTNFVIDCKLFTYYPDKCINKTKKS